MGINIPEEQHDKAIIMGADNEVKLSGEIDQRNPAEYLNDFFNKVITQMDQDVTVDVRQLYYINSSGIRCLINFIMHRKPETKILFKINPSRLWQRQSMKVIKQFDMKNITIEEYPD